MKNPLSHVLAALLGLGVGFTIANIVAIPMLWPEISVPAPESPMQFDTVEKSAPVAEVAAARRSADEHAEEAPRAPSEGLISAALHDYARDGIRAGWRESRNEEIPDEPLAAGTKLFEERLRALPKNIGSELAAQRTREEQLAEDARRGGAFALLESLAKGGGSPATALVSDAEGFGKLLERALPETTMRAERLEGNLAKHMESGKTYEYGVGAYEISIDFNGIKEVPSDVTIAGAGMNRTLLVLKGDIFSARPLRRFSIRDCTVYTHDNYLFDQRVSPATVLLERLRVIGFDMGAGGSCALGFSGPGLVLLARDSRFEGGYGRSPQHGRLFSGNTQVLVARFERCHVDRTALELNGGRSGTTIVFDQCALTDLTDSAPRFLPPERKLEYEGNLRASPGVVIAATTISFFDNAAWHLEKTDWTVPSRDLNELFPGWKEQLQR